MFSSIAPNGWVYATGPVCEASSKGAGTRPAEESPTWGRVSPQVPRISHATPHVPVFKDFRWGQAGILANLCTSRLKDRGHSPILISHISPQQRTDRGKTTGFSEKKFGISGVERGDRFFKLSPFRNPHFLAQKWRYFTVNKPAPTTLGIFCPNRGLWYRSEWPI